MAGRLRIVGPVIPFGHAAADTESVLAALRGATDSPFADACHRDAPILVSAMHFGNGPAPEAAVRALLHIGVQAVIAPGFGTIFAAEAPCRGLVPVRLPTAQIDDLLDMEFGHLLVIDVPAGRVIAPHAEMAFLLPPGAGSRLITIQSHPAQAISSKEHMQ